jgi:hypothetical protein
VGVVFESPAGVLFGASPFEETLKLVDWDEPFDWLQISWKFGTTFTGKQIVSPGRTF